jgi:hypothetical protein
MAFPIPRLAPVMNKVLSRRQDVLARIERRELNKLIAPSSLPGVFFFEHR